MDTFQIILVLAGVGFGVYVFLNSKEGEKKPVETKKEELVEVPLPKPVEVVDNHTHNFMCLVQKWDELRKCCHEQGLHDACDILNDQVFPLLNKDIKHKGEVTS